MTTFTACYKQESPLGTTADTSDGSIGSESGSDGSGQSGGDAPTGGDDDAADDSTASSGGDDEGDTDTGDTDGADADEIAPVVQALCGWEFECCSAGERDYRLGPFSTDVDDCVARFNEQVLSNDNTPELQRNDLLYTLAFAVRLDRSSPNAEAASACAERIGERACNDPSPATSCVSGSDPTDDPCDLRHLFTGTQSVGQPCSEALALLGMDIECELGSSCEQLDGDYVCVDKGLEGEFCEADDKCDEGLYCDIEVGRCAVRADEGDHCEFDDPEKPDPGSEKIPCLEHLSCAPQTETCVAYCSSLYDCVDDSACPMNESCIPVDIDALTYTYCLPRADTNGDRCDTDRDCVDSMHCSLGSCRADAGIDDACVTDNECESGLFCDLAGGHLCQIVVNANQACSTSSECNPTTTLGCMTSDDGRLCRTNLLINGAECVPGERDGDNWCASRVCEDVSDDATANPVCRVGGSVGQECDENDGTVNIGRCADGLYCLEGECKLKSPAGGVCDDDGALQCANASCEQIWEGEYCTDAVPTGAADSVTCDGEE